MGEKNEKRMIRLPVRYGDKTAYEITISQSFEALPDAVSHLHTKEHRICVVTDSNVEKLYLREVMELLAPCCARIVSYVFPAGEEHKNIDEVCGLYTFLIENGFDRNDCLAALGGGVTGDMTGFAAATYMRGIRFIQIPTTLLSQVDSSIGGKTGVDLKQYKNMVGAFYQPAAVFINTSVLKTLSDEQYASGMGEVLKHGLIRDENYYEYLISHMEEIAERDPGVLRKVVEGSCRIKREVVEKDPKEKGERALLNFGHTIGHAIEKQKAFSLPHGHCVSLGMVAAAYISWKRGLLDDMEFGEIRDMMVGFDLPISFDGLSSAEVLEATKHDKKMTAGHIRFVLLKGIGAAFTDMTVTDEEMLEAIDSINGELWDKR